MAETDGGRDERAWQMLQRVVDNSVVEQRRARRWGIFFKLLTFAYLFGAIWLFYPREGMKPIAAERYTAMIRVDGVIAPEEFASANNITAGLRRAFEDERARAVMLAINSPGGSPVQAGYVYNEIRRLREKHPDKKVYAVISDVGASGAYYIAAAADEIYADPASLVGSIGVISASFGLTELMEKMGVERRLFTGGENKALLDPFSPLRPEQQALWQSVIDTTHRQFIERVRSGRGDRLKESPELFSGAVWSGEQAIELGLIDAFGSPGQVARDVVGAEEVVDLSVGRDPFKELLKRLGTSVGEGAARSLIAPSPLLR
jgi:protease-4